MKVNSELHKTALNLARQRLSLEPIFIDTKQRPLDERRGYELQEYVNRIITGAGMGPVVGHKIGCTTPVMQEFLGIRNPCAGAIFNQTVRYGGVDIPRSGFVKIGIECEMAVEIGKDINPEDGPFTDIDIYSSVSGVMAAIEMVDDRYANYKSLGVPALIADNFFNSGCILGDPITKWQKLDLVGIKGRTVINGIEVGFGNGRAVMGNPLRALGWLVNSKRSLGQKIKKGDFVLLGSLVETKWLDKGDNAFIEIEGLGRLEVNVF